MEEPIKVENVGMTMSPDEGPAHGEIAIQCTSIKHGVRTGCWMNKSMLQKSTLVPQKLFMLVCGTEKSQTTHPSLIREAPGLGGSRGDMAR